MKKHFLIILVALLWCNVGFAEKIPDLTNSKWNVQKPKGVKKFLIEFYNGGKCKSSFEDWFNGTIERTDCQWSQNANNVIFYVHDRVIKFNGEFPKESEMKKAI